VLVAHADDGRFIIALRERSDLPSLMMESHSEGFSEERSGGISADVSGFLRILFYTTKQPRFQRIDLDLILSLASYNPQLREPIL
jgi:hypothetical protein